MVRGGHALFLLPVVAVDLNPSQPFGQRRGRQEEIDSEPPVPVEGSVPVIPPGEFPFLREALPVKIHQSPVQQSPEPGSFLVGVEDLPSELLFVPGVQRSGTDVEVAAQDQGLGNLVPLLQVGQERIEPEEFSGEVVVPHVLSVWTVDGDEGHAGHAGTHQAGAQVLLPRQPRLKNGGWFPAQDGHAVPGLGRMDRRPVAPRPELGMREEVLVHLQLLQSHEVGTAGIEPVKNVVESGPKPVDVPGGDPHACSPAASVYRNRWECRTRNQEWRSGFAAGAAVRKVDHGPGS